jgi:uncharacterized membrane protein YkoI
MTFVSIDKKSAALGAAAAVIVGAGGVTYAAMANAADATPSPSPNGTTTAPDASGDGARHKGAETELSGATAASVKAAILKALPGATVERMSTEDSAEGTGAAYEAHVTKADGSHVEVLLDKSFTVLKVTAGGRGGPGGRGGHGGNEAELTGATATSVKAAVLKSLPGATIERLSTEDAAEGTGAAYEAHVTKKDGTRVEVLLDKSFKVLKVTADPGHGEPGRGDRHGPPPASDSSSSSSSYTTSA